MSSDQQQPYDPGSGYDPYYGNQQSYGEQQPYGQQEHGQREYEQQQYGQQHGNGQPYGQQQPYGHQDPHVTQTWEGQTWDTQYQPVVQQPAPAPQPFSADTAYLPPQAAAHPLPEETPASAPAAAEAPAAPGTASAGGPDWSSPTTSGHTRLTDAQRARAEGRSPIIPPGIQPAALTAGLGALLAVGAALGPYGLLLPLVLLQAVTAAGWFRLNGMWPARQGIALAFAGGLTADVVLLAAGRENAPAAIMGTLGVWVLLTLVLQLRSHADPDERMYGLMATVASAALTVVAAGHLGAAPDAVVVGGLAVA
ncbi:hypothetical protein, partial [Streptomyces sp. NPDC047981]|uniref:hypothetical protein n=1 Tax=Streptomyces sp. NPDC047981 TaxID=3154610 RepID=UPI00342EDE18